MTSIAKKLDVLDAAIRELNEIDSHLGSNHRVRKALLKAINQGVY